MNAYNKEETLNEEPIKVAQNTAYLKILILTLERYYIHINNFKGLFSNAYNMTTYHEKRLKKISPKLSNIYEYQIKLNSTINTTKNINIIDRYKKSNLIYIQYEADIITKDDGKQKIKGYYPAYSKITRQPTENNKNYYSLLMGRQYELNKFLILLDLDNKENIETDATPATENGLKFIDLFKLDDFNTPTATTPNGGRHYLFFCDALQYPDVCNSQTTLKYNNIVYNADIKCKHGLMNCEPSKIDNLYYKWLNPERLDYIQQLPDILYDVIISSKNAPKQKHERPQTLQPKAPPQVVEVDIIQTEYDEEDIKALLNCLSSSRIDAYSNWFSLGTCLKKIGCNFKIWDDISLTNPKYKNFEMLKKWGSMHSERYNIGTLMNWCKYDNIEAYYDVLPSLKLHLKYLFGSDEIIYKSIQINTPYLMAKDTEPNEGQEQFKSITNDFFKSNCKSLIIKSKYNSGKTTFLKDVFLNNPIKKALIITYRQSLAMDYNKNFKQLGFKNYLDQATEDVYNSDKLIIQLDSLLKILQNNDNFILDGVLNIKYDIIIIDEIESLIRHIDQNTMDRKDILIYDFLNKLLSCSDKIIALDADINNRSLSFLTPYGDYKYIINNNIDENKEIYLMRNPATFYADIYKNIEIINNKMQAGDTIEDAGRLAVACQSVSALENLKKEIVERYKHVVIFSLTGLDSNETKKNAFLDIDETVKKANIILYSPCIESGVDILTKVNFLYGILAAKSSTQAGFCQMLSRCRRVQNPEIKILNDPSFKISKNNNSYKLWTYNETKQYINDNLNDQKELFLTDNNVRFESSQTYEARKNISIYNKMEVLNTNKNIYITYLNILMTSKGYKFKIEEETDEPIRRKKVLNHKLNLVLTANDISVEQYKILLNKQTAQQTTTEEAHELQKYFYKKLLNVSELNETILKPFLYNNELIYNFKCLIDPNNIHIEHNVKSTHRADRVKYINLFLDGLGFNNLTAEQTITEDDITNNFKKNIYDNELIMNNMKYINVIFEYTKNYSFNIDMTPRQILGYMNAIFKNYSINIKASTTTKRDGKTTHAAKSYKLIILNNIIDIIKNQYETGETIEDSKNYLNLQPRTIDHGTDDGVGLDHDLYD